MYDELLKVITLLEKYENKLENEKVNLCKLKVILINEYTIKFEDMLKIGLINTIYGIGKKNETAKSYIDVINLKCYDSRKDYVISHLKKDIRYDAQLKYVENLEDIVNKLNSSKQKIENKIVGEK